MIDPTAIKKLIPFNDEVHRVIPAIAFIRDPWRKEKESFMLYRKAMRNMAIATKHLNRYGSIHAHLIINRRTLEVVTNVQVPKEETNVQAPA